MREGGNYEIFHRMRDFIGDHHDRRAAGGIAGLELDIIGAGPYYIITIWAGNQPAQCGKEEIMYIHTGNGGKKWVRQFAAATWQLRPEVTRREFRRAQNEARALERELKKLLVQECASNCPGCPGKKIEAGCQCNPLVQTARGLQWGIADRKRKCSIFRLRQVRRQAFREGLPAIA